MLIRKNKLLLIIFLLLNLIFFKFVFADNLKNNTKNKNNILLTNKEKIQKIITNNQIVLDTYKVWEYKFNVFSIPKWKYDIMSELGLTYAQMINYHTINSIECSDEFGRCVNKRDIGPFQININNHKEAYDYSNKLLKEGNFKELYKFQLKFTKERLERFKKTVCKDRPEDKKISNDKRQEITFGCMLVVHNGNNREWKEGTNFKIKNLFKIKGLLNREILLRLTGLQN